MPFALRSPLVLLICVRALDWKTVKDKGTSLSKVTDEKELP